MKSPPIDQTPNLIVKHNQEVDSRFLEEGEKNYPHTIYQLNYRIGERDIGFVIGTKGHKIQKINRESGAHAEFQYDHVLRNKKTGEEMNYFLIWALDPTAAQNAWKMINIEVNMSKWWRARKSSDNLLPIYTIILRICGEDTGLIIGRKGATIKSIKKMFGLNKLYVKCDEYKSMCCLHIVSHSEDAIKRTINHIMTRFSKIIRNCEKKQQKRIMDSRQAVYYGDDENLSLMEFREKHALEYMTCYKCVMIGHKIRKVVDDIGWGNLESSPLPSSPFKHGAELQYFDFSKFSAPSRKPTGYNPREFYKTPSSPIVLAPVPKKIKKVKKVEFSPEVVHIPDSS
tara:strand:- start:1882 stop:2907 length:1026 start_codon:yes stop_codon:yes gene_type:complete